MPPPHLTQACSRSCAAEGLSAAVLHSASCISSRAGSDARSGSEGSPYKIRCMVSWGVSAACGR